MKSDGVQIRTPLSFKTRKNVCGIVCQMRRGGEERERGGRRRLHSGEQVQCISLTLRGEEEEEEEQEEVIQPGKN